MRWTASPPISSMRCSSHRVLARCRGEAFMKPQDRGILRQRSFSGQNRDGGGDRPRQCRADRHDAAHRARAGAAGALQLAQMGQWFETQGHNGEEPDTPGGKRLLALYKEWLSATEDTRNAAIWREMLALHARTSGRSAPSRASLQPVVVNNAAAQRARKGAVLLGADLADGRVPDRRILLRGRRLTWRSRSTSCAAPSRCC